MEKDKGLPSWLVYLVVLFTLMLFHYSQSLAQEKDGCIKCHSKLEGKLAAPVKEWSQSVHKEVRIFCSDCHGGNPESESAAEAKAKEAGYIGKPRTEEIPALCAKCHADIQRMRQYNIRTDQYAEYLTSVHGKLLMEKGDTRVATCVSCHNTHEIRRKRDPLASVYHTNVPETCGRCHSDQARMKPYNIPTDQLSLYKKSYHGQILYGKIPEKNPALVPNCATCHGIHGATPPGVSEVPNVCGNCHGVTANAFREGPHYIALEETGMPRCIDCHGNHKIDFPSLAMFDGSEEGHCGMCHSEDDDQTYGQGQKIKQKLTAVLKALEEGKEGVEEVERAGRNVDDILTSLEKSHDEIVQATILTHTLDPKKIDKLTESIMARIEGIRQIVGQVRHDLKIRKRALAFFSAWIFLAAGLLYIKHRSLSQ
jgi:hypothetical protein